MGAATQDVGDMQILALLQQAQVQRAAEEALSSMEHRAVQAEAASEQHQQQALQVCLTPPAFVLWWNRQRME